MSARYVYRNVNTGAMLESALPVSPIPAGYVQTPEPDGAFILPQQQYQPGYSGDRFGGGGNPSDAPANLKFRPPGE